MSTTSEAYGKG